MAVHDGPIENLHAGKWSPLLEAGTRNRLTDAEMKAVMVYAARTLALMLRLRDEASRRPYPGGDAVLGHPEGDQRQGVGCPVQEDRPGTLHARIGGAGLLRSLPPPSRDPGSCWGSLSQVSCINPLCLLAGEVLIAVDDHVAVGRREFQAIAPPS
jgi:hypothetical protein